ncbi:MAG: class I SAM-dependent methyltransferase [Selenomonadaceae bacterium]|nr:class I SAM-dependent methyltransferase [Selenomonadaceae bacterium]
MRCIVFARAKYYKFFTEILSNAKLQSGVDLTGFLELSDQKLYKFHCGLNQNLLKVKMKEVSSIQLDKTKFDKIYIIGADFELRQQLLDLGIDHKKISMTYGMWKQFFDGGNSYFSVTADPIFKCHCPLDEIFILPKLPPEVPFQKAPAEIYREYAGETAKAHDRRVREGFFDKYCKGEGLDVGYGGDIIVPDCSGWDFRNGDAQYLAGIDDESFDFVYSSHCLEHMYDVQTALKNWFRVVKKGGYLLLAIPHRDLYEKRKQLPSRWNNDHKHMFLIGRSEPPDTLDIVEEIKNALEGYDIKYIKTCDEGHTIIDPLVHSDGEYQIEIVIQKIS